MEDKQRPMPSIKPTSGKGSDKKSKTKDQTPAPEATGKKSSKQPQKAEWQTHFAYLNDKRREILLAVPDLPKPSLKEKKLLKKRKYVDKRIRVDKLDIVGNLDKTETKKSELKKIKPRSRSTSSTTSSSKSRSRSRSNSSDDRKLKKKVSHHSDSDSASSSERNQSSNKNHQKRDSLQSGSFSVKKRSKSAVGNERDLKHVNEFKREHSGYPFHFESYENSGKGSKDSALKKPIQKYNKVNYNEEEKEELRELNKAYRDSRKEVLVRRSKLDLDKRQIDHDLNYDLINAMNELEVKPAYKNLLRSIRSNLYQYNRIRNYQNRFLHYHQDLIR